MYVNTFFRITYVSLIDFVNTFYFIIAMFFHALFQSHVKPMLTEYVLNSR